MNPFFALSNVSFKTVGGGTAARCFFREGISPLFAFCAFFAKKTLAILRAVYYNNKKCDIRRCVMNKIKTIARPAAKKVTGCGECRSTCQSACKTSCTVGNQSCERISRENDPEKNN